jgi:DNA polymerase-1
MTALGKTIREGFIPSPGYSFLSVDYSQLEARVLAHLSKDEHLCHIFNSGGDVFRGMAAEWYGVKSEDINDEVRYVTKHNFYGIQNGLTAEGLSIRLRGECKCGKVCGCGLRKWTVDRVQEFMDGFFQAFPGIAEAISRWHAEARATGMVRDMWGRYRYLPQVRSTKKHVREAGLRAAQNFNMPGGASGIMKIAMKLVWDYIQDKASIFPNLQIHDELLFEAEQGTEESEGQNIAHLMEGAVKLRVPLVAKYAYSTESWGAIPK